MASPNSESGSIDGNQTLAKSTATVADAPLHAKGLPASALAGTSFTAPLATFNDADPGDSASTYGVSINWGDGSATTTGMVGGSGGSFGVGGTHTYASAGIYTAILTINDPGGSSTTASSVPDRIVIAVVAKLTLYGFRPLEGRFPEFPGILENAGATGLGESTSALRFVAMGRAGPNGQRLMREAATRVSC